MSLAERFAVSGERRFDGWVTDIVGRKAMLGEEGDFERQERHEMIHALAESLRAARAPGPGLRRDIMRDGNARAAQLAGDPQGETRRVDRHHDVGLHFANRRGGLVDALHEARQVRQDFGNADQRKLAHGKQAFQTLSFALRTAYADDADPVPGHFPQRANQPPGKVVAGWFARNDKDQRFSPAHDRLPLASVRLGFRPNGWGGASKTRACGHVSSRCGYGTWRGRSRLAGRDADHLR